MSKSVHIVALALVRRGPRWLVTRRKNESHLGGLWEFPGGAQQAGESPTEAALRELYEECAVRAVAEDTLPTTEWEYDDRIVQLTPVVCRWQKGKARSLGNAGCRWVTAAELRELAMPPANAGIVLAALGEPQDE